MSCLKVNFLNLELSSPFIAQVDSNITCDDDFIPDNYGAIYLPPFVLENYINNVEESEKIINYIEEIKYWKNKANLPIIAGIDFPVNIFPEELCMQIEKAGTDILYLKIYLFPDDKDFHSIDYEKIFFETAAKVAYCVKIPVIIELPVYFTNLFNIVEQLFYRGIQGFFPSTRNYLFDIDLDHFEITHLYRDSFDYHLSLKWISYLSAYFPKADFFIQSNRYISFEVKIKLMLSGCHAFIEKYDPEKIQECIDQVKDWMQKHGFEKTEHFLGQVNFQINTSPSSFERENNWLRN